MAGEFYQMEVMIPDGILGDSDLPGEAFPGGSAPATGPILVKVKVEVIV